MLLWTLAINAAAVSLVGMIKRLDGTQKYACGEPFNYPQVSTVKNPENLEKLIYNRFGLL
jgi:hypothetical protein